MSCHALSKVNTDDVAAKESAVVMGCHVRIAM